MSETESTDKKERDFTFSQKNRKRNFKIYKDERCKFNELFSMTKFDESSSLASFQLLFGGVTRIGIITNFIFLDENLTHYPFGCFYIIFVINDYVSRKKDNNFSTSLVVRSKILALNLSSNIFGQYQEWRLFNTVLNDKTYTIHFSRLPSNR
ncbi:hypothetical protein PGB90_007566 [Kerria lacca]